MNARCQVGFAGLTSGLACLLSACGGGGSMMTASNPTPAITAISPSNATRGGPAFTLTANGSNFVAGAAVQWNGSARPTAFVSSSQVNAQISADDIVAAGTEGVTVFNPGPGGGTSNSLQFNIPCVLAPAGPGSSQTRARLGTVYFDGWAGPLTSYHLTQLVNTTFQYLQPLSGWRDDNPCAVEQALAWAKNFGIDFFVFDWYYKAQVFSPTENLNSAIEITHTLSDRHGMQFAILYVDQDPFIIAPADWTSAFNEWIGFMKDSAYLPVNGKPYFGVIDIRLMRQAFGSSAAVNAALGQLRAAAQAQGLPGVYIVGYLNAPDGAPQADGLFPDLSSAQADGYDAVSEYGYGFSEPLGLSGAQPFSVLADTGKWTWNQAVLKSPLPVIPVAMDGSDARSPEGDQELGRPLYWFNRSPQEVATFVGDIITLAESNPQVRAEPAPTPPLVMISAWNELGNGSYMVPTIGDGTGYGDALAATLAIPAPQVRTLLTVNDSGPSDPIRSASGHLTDANGAPIIGASITITDSPVAGVFTQYQLSGQPPAGATQAVVGFRVNTDDPTITWPSYWFAGPASSNFSLYQVSYVQPADGIERVPNGDFSLGAQSWALHGQTQLVPSNRGAGQMVQVTATPSQFATLDSQPFAITPGAPFQTSFFANLPPLFLDSGYFMLAFSDGTLGNFLDIPGTSVAAVHAESLPFTPGKTAFGKTITDSAGYYQLSLSSLGTSQVILEATYVGDAQHWPAYAKVGP
jgi:hypothetical protein